MVLLTKRNILIILIFLTQNIQACHGACSDEITVCSSAFSVNKRMLGPTQDGICSLARDFVACVTALSPGCNTQEQGNINSGVQGIKSTYETSPYNCTLDVNAMDVAKACMRQFDNCCLAQTSADPCGYVALYESCLTSTRTYCTQDATEDATQYIASRSDNLTRTHGCDFGNMSTTTRLLTGTDCFQMFNDCKAAKLTSEPPNICLAIPVYTDCLENRIKVICDIHSYSVVEQYVATLVSSNRCEQTTPTAPHRLSTSQPSKSNGVLILGFGDSASTVISLNLAVVIAISKIFLYF